jgi:hypothetical protein
LPEFNVDPIEVASIAVVIRCSWRSQANTQNRMVASKPMERIFLAIQTPAVPESAHQ